MRLSAAILLISGVAAFTPSSSLNTKARLTTTSLTVGQASRSETKNIPSNPDGDSKGWTPTS